MLLVPVAEHIILPRSLIIMVVDKRQWHRKACLLCSHTFPWIENCSSLNICFYKSMSVSETAHALNNSHLYSCTYRIYCLTLGLWAHIKYEDRQETRTSKRRTSKFQLSNLQKRNSNPTTPLRRLALVSSCDEENQE